MQLIDQDQDQGNLRIIAFAGPKTCGKDTAAKYLLSRNSLFRHDMFVNVNFADPLKQICMKLFGLSHNECYNPILKEVVLTRWPFKSPRELLQSLAHLMRTMYAQDIWVKAWERTIPTLRAECIIITDLRHPEELEKLRELGGKLFYVHNPKIEEERLIGRQAGDPRWSDISEAYAEVLRQEADQVIENDGHNLTSLYQNVHAAFTLLFGDFAAWDKELEPIKGVL